MYDRNSIIDLIEGAERDAPLCACGAPMVAQQHQGSLWLACASRREGAESREGMLARFRSLDWLTPHDRRLLLDATELEAAWPTLPRTPPPADAPATRPRTGRTESASGSRWVDRRRARGPGAQGGVLPNTAEPCGR